MSSKSTQPIDGVNNLEYWMGKTDESARNNYIYYYESSIKAIRYKQWKLATENYYAPYVKQKFPLMYNIRMDPFESFDGVTDRSDIVQAKQWLNEPMQHILGEHIKTLPEYPPCAESRQLRFQRAYGSTYVGQAIELTNDCSGWRITPPLNWALRMTEFAATTTFILTQKMSLSVRITDIHVATPRRMSSITECPNSREQSFR
jgi:hypothetical protein